MKIGLAFPGIVKIPCCYMVWLQGRVDFISSERDSVQLSDGRGSKVKLQLSGVAQVKCTKLTDLSDNKHMQQMWDLEVTEFQNFLSGRIAFIV